MMGNEKEEEEAKFEENAKLLKEARGRRGRKKRGKSWFI